MERQPPIPVMYRALLARDSLFEGVFFVGVRTTGVFCRPTCPAKKPRPENVEYFGTAQEALARGYRPCLRCSPLSDGRPTPQSMRRLWRAVEQSTDGRVSDADLRAIGLDPSTARRQFRRHLGMSFQAYLRARRMGLALRQVQAGAPVIDVQLNHGFDSASGFGEAFKRVFGVSPSRADGVECLLARRLGTPLGDMLALAGTEGLVLLEFVDRRGLERELLVLQKRRRYAVVPGDSRHLEQIARELTDYFSGATLRFTVPLVTFGSPFEQAVWRQLQAVPPGETCSYAELARRVGRPGADRAVGRANGRNILALAIPCHRVVRTDGGLAGYGGGVWRKRWLLEHERRITLGA